MKHIYSFLIIVKILSSPFTYFILISTILISTHKFLSRFMLLFTLWNSSQKWFQNFSYYNNTVSCMFLFLNESYIILHSGYFRNLKITTMLNKWGYNNTLPSFIFVFSWCLLKQLLSFFEISRNHILYMLNPTFSTTR